MVRKHWPVLLILLLTLGLRVYRLTDLPPGLTHDEANHGREALEIRDGVLRYFFPLNYGSEPLYSYTVAGSMTLFGENLFALRLVNVLFGLAAIAITYAWAKKAFTKRLAMATAVLMALSFWPLATSREALRAGMLPFFMTVAVWFYWQIVMSDTSPQSGTQHGPQSGWHRSWPVLGFAVSIVVTLHIYLAARVAWLLFPTFLLYLALVHRNRFRVAWKPVLVGLLLAGLLSLPMFIYLANNPESQTRLSMLSNPLQLLQSDQLLLTVQRAGSSLLAFVWPGFGDQFLAYNIPGRPVFEPLSAFFFVLGIGVCAWRWRKPANFFVLLWFFIGIAPSLLTGATANTTRNLAALPAVYILPAVGFWATTDWLFQRFRLPQRATAVALAAVWLLLAGSITARDYFVRWGESPQVRGAYQHTLIEELAYLEQMKGILPETPLVMSSVYPGAAHDASIAMLLAGSRSADMRWVDARFGLLIPEGDAVNFFIPTSTPLHPAFEALLEQQDRVSLHTDDLDPGFGWYTSESTQLEDWRRATAVANFSGAVNLLDAFWLTTNTKPGETAEMLTVWRVSNPTRVGPLHSPADAPDTVIFTHVLDTDGQILVQRDALDAPSWSWQAGDLILQIHPLVIPSETPPGFYPSVVGLYDRPTGERLFLQGDTGASFLPVAPLQVTQSKN